MTSWDPALTVLFGQMRDVCAATIFKYTKAELSHALHRPVMWDKVGAEQLQKNTLAYSGGPFGKLHVGLSLTNASCLFPILMPRFTIIVISYKAIGPQEFYLRVFKMPNVSLSHASADTRDIVHIFNKIIYISLH